MWDYPKQPDDYNRKVRGPKRDAKGAEYICGMTDLFILIGSTKPQKHRFIMFFVPVPLRYF
jgi:hypothetical protein